MYVNNEGDEDKNGDVDYDGDDDENDHDNNDCALNLVFLILKNSLFSMKN